MKNFQFTAHIGKDSATGLFYGIVPNLPGAHTQGATLDELNDNLEEVVALCLEGLDEEEISEISQFVGTQQISVNV